MEALKAEINMLRRKGGHVYTPVCSLPTRVLGATPYSHAVYAAYAAYAASPLRVCSVVSGTDMKLASSYGATRFLGRAWY